MTATEHDTATEAEPDRRSRVNDEAQLVAAIRANSFPGLSSSPARSDADVLRFGRYTIVRKLGEGGMGVVFAGYDEQLDRKVAIKLLRRRYQDQVARLRLEREAQALARLSHPNVVQVYELGEHQGSLFVAMEFVRGETLRAWLAETRDWQTIAEVLRQAGAGLAAAHEAGLVHRDFKPANVIVGADGRARVLDFGLARELDGDSGELRAGSTDDDETESDRALTRTGATMGTPGYMAPEQLAGRPCDARADQFAFCVVASEALLGQASKVPPRLEAVIRRGLASEPSERWPDMPTLLAEFDRAMDPGRRRRRVAWAAGVAAVMLSVGLTAWTMHSESALCVFDETALAGTWDDDRRVALAAAFAARSSPSTERALSLIEQSLDDWSAQWLASRRSTCEATRVVGDQSEAMLDLRSSCLERQRRAATAIVDVLVQDSGEGVDRAFELLDQLPDTRECEDPRLGETAHPLPAQPERREAILVGYAQLSRARALGSNGQIDEADAIAEELRSLDYDYLPLRIEVQALAAEQALWRQSVAEAVPQLRAAIREAEIAGLDELSASLRTMLAQHVVGKWGRPEVQAATLEEAETSVARVGRDDDLRELELQLARGAWLEDAGDDEAALVRYQASIEAAQARGATGLLARAQRMLALLLVRLERFDAAAQAFADARASFETWRPGSLVIADIELDLGRLELGRARFEAAELHFARARELYEPVIDPHAANLARLELADAKLALLRGEFERAEAGFAHVAANATEELVLADAWEALGVVRFYRADFAGSIAAYERALDHRLATLGPEHPDVGLLRANLGESLAAIGDYQGALAAYAEALALLTRALPAEHLDLAVPYKGRGQARLALGDPDGARVDLERALALHEANPGEPIERADVEFSLARTLHELGERDDAFVLANAALQRYHDLGQPESVADISAWLEGRQQRPPTH
jgi:serine/threonine protein kinase/Tfp pilus assembly protein PilF